jgi:hypothetical protein
MKETKKTIAIVDCETDPFAPDFLIKPFAIGFETPIATLIFGAMIVLNNSLRTSIRSKNDLSFMHTMAANSISSFSLNSWRRIHRQGLSTGDWCKSFSVNKNSETVTQLLIYHLPNSRKMKLIMQSLPVTSREAKQSGN